MAGVPNESTTQTMACALPTHTKTAFFRRIEEKQLRVEPVLAEVKSELPESYVKVKGILLVSLSCSCGGM
jgi:hypothetical protein